MAGDSVRQIKDRLSIIDVISPYVELHQAGKHMKGKSPFTSEKTPSFYVSPDRGMYYCFSSSQGGDMFTFIEKMEGVDFKGALKILADKAGVELVPEDPKKRSERDTQYTILESATKYFESELKQNDEATKYLKKRGLEEKTIGLWRIGYVPGPPKNGWRHTREALKKQGFNDQQLLKAGLVKKAGEGKEPYDVFRDRIMFPMADASGRVVAFSGRVLEPGGEAPKYVNSPETELFNKSEILFGYDKAKQGIRQYDFSLIVEGQFDVVLAHQAGYTNAVAVSGTALTEHHVGLLQRLSNRVVLALDADRAGLAAVKRAADLMLGRGIDLKVAQLPDGQDPADLIAAGSDTFKKIIGQSTHVIEFLLSVLAAEGKDERAYKLRARDEIVPYLLKLESSIDREHFIGVIAKQLETSSDAIALEVARLAAYQSEEPVVSGAGKPEVALSHENRLESVKQYVAVVGEVVEERERKVIENIFAEIVNQTARDYRKTIPTEKVSELVFRLEQQFDGLQSKLLYEELSDRLTELYQLELKSVLKTEKQLLQEAERNGESKRISECLERINELQKKLSASPYGVDIFDKSKS